MMIEAKRPPAERGVAQAYLASAAVKVAEAESFTIGQSYERAVDLIMAAKGNVTVVGGRFSRHVAGMLASYLAQLRPGISAQDILSVESFERSEERRVGQEGVSTCSSRWSTYQ